MKAPKRIVLLLASGAVAAACSSEPTGTSGTQSQTTPDGGQVPMDSGAAGGDGGTGPSNDSGTQPPRDSGGSAYDAGSTVPTGAEVSATCTDGRYAETLSDPSASISAVVSGFQSANYRQFIVDVLAIRYPTGAFLVQNAPTSQNDCLDLFVPTSDRASASTVIENLETVVHECGHVYDMSLRTFGSTHYQITQSKSFQCNGASYNGSNLTFARSEIRNDSFSAQRPPCPATGPMGCDDYADVYLDGSPTNSTFESGDQGFNMVLEEAVQYVNSLAVGRAMEDQMRSGLQQSTRDGILTYLWYIERYLHRARTVYPNQYSYLMGSAPWRDAILTVWGRAWLYLKATEGHTALGIDDAQINTLVHDPVLMDEIARVRTASGCP